MQVPQLPEELRGLVGVAEHRPHPVLVQLLPQELLHLLHQLEIILVVLVYAPLAVVHRLLQVDKGDVHIPRQELVGLGVDVAGAEAVGDDRVRGEVRLRQRRAHLDHVRGTGEVRQAQPHGIVPVPLPLSLQGQHAQAREHLAGYGPGPLEAVDDLRREVEGYQEDLLPAPLRLERCVQPVFRQPEKLHAGLPYPGFKKGTQGLAQLGGEDMQDALHLRVAHAVRQQVDYSEYLVRAVYQSFVRPHFPMCHLRSPPDLPIPMPN